MRVATWNVNSVKQRVPRLLPWLDAREPAATCGGIRVLSVYVPNGREPGSVHYEYKLAWLAALRDALERELTGGLPLAVCGDFNVAPTDADVWDAAAFAGSTHVTAAERDAGRAGRAVPAVRARP